YWIVDPMQQKVTVLKWVEGLYEEQVFQGNERIISPILPDLKLLMVAFALFFSILGGEAVFAMWCDQQFGWGPQQFGYLIIFYFLAIASIQIGLTGHLAHWLGESKLLLWSLAALTMGLFLRPFSTTVPQLVGSMLFVIFAEATGIPTFTSLLSRLSGARQQGRTLGLMQSVSGLGGFVGASGAGYVFGAWGVHWPYWISALLMAVATVLCWRYITQTDLRKVMYGRRRKKLLRLFHLLDHNKSGTLELNDFQRAGRRVAKLRGWESGTTEYDVLQVSFIGFGEMLQQLADRDGNRKIDEAEWLHAFLDQPIDQEFASLFLQIFDINRDHQIAFEELRTFYQAYGISTADLEDVFYTLDLDQDGRISTEEFDTIFAQFLYSDDVQAPGNWMFGVGLPRQL
ncbi:MAG: MFS transporter, partial [Merismopedia sp. SIO2A8]|nr:MFS transporter [Merismopedia sp. SIO2A8]